MDEAKREKSGKFIEKIQVRIFFQLFEGLLSLAPFMAETRVMLTMLY